jgi:LacI family transcriptional regulator
LEKKMAATLKEIAERVGRSVTTVSRALAGYDDVSKQTRDHVQRVARELGYEPNIAARQLQRRRSDTLAIILPTFGPRFSDPFFSELLAGVGNEAARHGFDMLISTRPPGQDETDAYLKHIRSRRVDGFVVVRTRRHDARIDLLKDEKFPFVAFGRVEDNPDFLYVDEDSEWGIQLMVNHLLSLGHKRLAYLTAPQTLMFAHYRMRGFVASMQSHGLPVDPNLILEGDLSQRHGRELAGQLLDQPNPPTAIVACNDLMALGAMSATQERGLIVGQDISISGFDDIPPAEHAHPPLTTIHQPVHKIGTMVCQMLIKTIQGEHVDERQVLLRPSLVVRQSTGPAKPAERRWNGAV